MTPDLVNCRRQFVHLGKREHWSEACNRYRPPHLLLDVVGDTLGKLHHVVFIAEYGHDHLCRHLVFLFILNDIHLLHPTAEVIQSIGVDIPKRQELTEVKVLLKVEINLTNMVLFVMMTRGD